MPLYVPSSLDELLFLFRPCFTAPTHETFRALVTGFLAQVGTHTVTGCLLASLGAARMRLEHLERAKKPPPL